MNENSKFYILKSFAITASALVGYQLTICLPFVICSIFIGRLGDEIALGAYGITLTLINVAFNGVVMGIQEAFGIIATKLYGSKKPKEIPGYFYKSIIITIGVSMIFHIFTHHSYSFLVFIGVEEIIAWPSYLLMKKASWFLYFQGINGVINNFLSTQHITKPLYILNVSSIFSIYLFATLFIEKLGYREIGFAYTKLCQELFSFGFYLILMFRYIDRSLFKLPPSNEIFHKFWSYLKFNLFTSLGFYGEFLSFEINTYYAALLHNAVALATWVTFVNYSVIFYFASIGFANAMRNYLGKKLAEHKIDEARSDSKLYFKFIGIITFIIMVLQLVFKETIASIYTTNDRIIEQLKTNLALHIFGIYSTLTLLAFNSVYRTLGQDTLQLQINVFLYPLTIAFISFVLCFALGLNVEGLNISLTICKTFIVGLMAYGLYYKMEWTYIKPDDTRDESLGEEMLSSILDPESNK